MINKLFDKNKTLYCYMVVVIVLFYKLVQRSLILVKKTAIIRCFNRVLIV